MRPQLIVTVGRLAARRLLGVKSITECVGVHYELEHAVAVPLPHPSGASGWLNEPANRARVAHAATRLKQQLRRLGLA
jgi:uracil-DNA glycosylase